MILVAVGTTGFDRLVEAMDTLSLSLPEKVVIQIGPGKYVPKHCQYFRFSPTLDSYYQQCSVVVSHGGLGIVTEVMNRRLPLVAVEDQLQPDRHQRQILSLWEKAGHLVWCREIEQLPQMIVQARKGHKPYVRPECRIHLIISEFLKRKR
jgi:UDP-N-acetylglucosamine transferase subunit ALG13